MSNTNAMRCALVVLALFGAYLVFAGLQLRYYMRTGPGPGFFPVWIGGLLALSSLATFGASLRDAVDRVPFIGTRDAVLRVGTVLLGLVLVVVLLETLGFRLAVLLFALTVPWVFGQQNPLLLIVFAVLVSFGTAYVFQAWLGVWLPSSSLPVLAALGL